MLSLNVGSNINQVAGWLTNVQRKQLPFATAGALTATAFDVRKYVVEKTFLRDFDLRNKRFAAAALRVEKANKRKLRAAIYGRLGREYLETQARGGIKRPTGQWISIPTELIQRTATGKIGKAKRPRNIVNKPNVIFRHQGPTPDIVRRPRGKGKQLEVLYQLVQRRMVPNFRKSFERAVRTARSLNPARVRHGQKRGQRRPRRSSGAYDAGRSISGVLGVDGARG